MSSRLKRLARLAVIAIAVAGFCGPSFAQDFALAEDMSRWCLEAKHGEFEPASAASLAPKQISYLVECTILPAAPPPGGYSRDIVSEADIAAARKKADQRIAAKQAKRVIIADALMTYEFNPNFMDDVGNPLITTTVISDLPVEWRVKAMTSMIEQGADIDVKNQYGQTALDLAKHRKQQAIIELLLGHSAK